MTALPRILAPEDLAAQIDAPDLALIEITSTPEGRSRSRGALPGSRVAFWKDLAWDARRREFATAEELSERLFALGAGEGKRIVLLGEPTQFAAYLIWVAHLRGYENLSYLDGGLEYWRAAGLPLDDGRDVPRDAPTAPLAIPARGDEQARIGRDGILAALGDPGLRLFDFRTAEEYSGARVSGPGAPIDHGAERHGRIPGAVHFFFRDLLDANGRFRPAAEIRAAAEARGAHEATQIINYCRLSHRASLGWLALTTFAGLPDVRVYDGSWTEWGSIVGFPIEK